MRIRFLAIGLIAGLLAACTGSKTDPKPRSTAVSRPASQSVSSSSPSPTQTGPLTTGPNVRPGEKPPAYPSLARQHSAAGAQAFAVYYFRSFDWGYATNDPFLVQQISDRGCQGCAKYINALKRLKANHGVLRRGRVQIVSEGLRHGNFRFKSDYVVGVTVNEEPVVIDSPGATSSTAAARSVNDESLVFVSWLRGQWKVVEVGANQ